MTPAAGRGGSTPPRPPARTPQQRFTVQPRLSGITAATGPLIAPGSPHTVALIGPGPHVDPQSAITADLNEPLIIATITGPPGEEAGPLLTDGWHLRCTDTRLGREHLPPLVLTATETRAIRNEITLGPGRWAATTETRR